MKRLVPLALVALFVASSVAAQPVRDSIVLDQAAPYTFGQEVTFTVATSRTEEPYVWLACEQDGERVYSHTVWFAPWATGSEVFTLGPTQLWTGGDATCEARLIRRTNGNIQTLERLGFEVNDGSG